MEAEKLGAKLSDVHALVDRLADSQADVEEKTLGYNLSDAQALVNTLADSQAQVER